MRIAFLHTADVHIATFDQIFAGMGGDVQLDHHVDASLLERARRDGPAAVRSDVTALLETLSDADAVLCTCSTLGPLADDAARSRPNIIRIDRPLMEQACKDGPKVLVAVCLDSTKDASLELLHSCALDANRPVTPISVVCADAWTHFEAGDMAPYAGAIAQTIKSKIAADPDVSCIVLAQASMQVAQTDLAETGIPVYSSPVLAAQRCLLLASATSKGPP